MEAVIACVVVEQVWPPSLHTSVSLSQLTTVRWVCPPAMCLSASYNHISNAEAARVECYRLAYVKTPNRYIAVHRQTARGGAAPTSPDQPHHEQSMYLSTYLKQDDIVQLCFHLWCHRNSS